MSDTDPAPSPGDQQPKFRLNAQVFQILGLLAVALALPITILILGLHGMRREQNPPKPSADAPEVPGLRESLESLAEIKMPINPIESSLCVYRLRPLNPEHQAKKRLEALNLFERSGAVFTDTEVAGCHGWIATVKASQIESFEKELLQIGFAADQTGASAPPKNGAGSIEASAIYKILIEDSK